MRYILTFICLIFLAFGLLAIIKGIQGYRNLNQSVPWEKVESVVDDVKFLTTLNEKKDSLFELKVQYHFNYEGKSYSKNQIEKVTEISSSKSILKYVYDEFKKAEKISVWINPKNPNESTYYPKYKDSPSKFINSIYFGFIFMILPIGGLIFLWGFFNLEKSVLDKIEMIN